MGEGLSCRWETVSWGQEPQGRVTVGGGAVTATFCRAGGADYTWGHVVTAALGEPGKGLLVWLLPQSGLI